jgi:hypothetical protein
MNYSDKYLKYKSKYLKLKSLNINVLHGGACDDSAPVLDATTTEVFTKLKITDETLKKEILELVNVQLRSLEKNKGKDKDTSSDLLNAYGPTPSNGWVHNQLLIGTIPYTCSELKTIIDIGKVTLMLSLREYNESYQYCKLTEEKTIDFSSTVAGEPVVKPTRELTEESTEAINAKIAEESRTSKKIVEQNYDNLIFWRFRINDYSTPNTVLETMAMTDSLINYIYKNPKNKLMIHCWGGHGRTGTMTCCVLAIILLLNTKPYKEKMDEFRNIQYKDTIKKIDEMSNDIFTKIQAYVMIYLRTYRKTDWPCVKEISSVVIPETHAQEHFVKDIITNYIQRYLEYGFMFDVPEETTTLLPKDKYSTIQDRTPYNKLLSSVGGIAEDPIWVKSGSEDTINSFYVPKPLSTTQ